VAFLKKSHTTLHFPVQSRSENALEEELRPELHNALSLFLGCDAKVLIRLGKGLRHWILLKLQVRLLLPLGNEYSG